MAGGANPEGANKGECTYYPVVSLPPTSARKAPPGTRRYAAWALSRPSAGSPLRTLYLHVCVFHAIAAGSCRDCFTPPCLTQRHRRTTAGLTVPDNETPQLVMLSKVKVLLVCCCLVGVGGGVRPHT